MFLISIYFTVFFHVFTLQLFFSCLATQIKFYSANVSLINYPAAFQSPVSVADQNGEVPEGSLVVRGYGARGAVRGSGGEAAEGVALVLYAPDQQDLLKHYKKHPPGKGTMERIWWAAFANMSENVLNFNIFCFVEMLIL